MLPDSVLSTDAIVAPFSFPRNIPKRPLVDYEEGGVALNDGSLGMQVRIWRVEIIDDDFVLTTPGLEPQVIYQMAGVKEVSLAFDRNMTVFLAYEFEAGGCEFFWFDTIANDYVVTQLPEGSFTPRCSLDDKRALQSASSDIILAYCRDGSLYYREQRDRYETEYLLNSAVGERGLVQIGMNRANRFQFMLST